jgi:hydrophobe/amphiphile efflux-1 (HAE1) family protein
MEEVSGALVAITIVLLAVFLPSALVPGVPGIFYRQFAVTISAASAISLLVSLTLSPALAAILLKPRTSGNRGRLEELDRLGSQMTGAYGRFTARLVRARPVVLAIYVGLIVLTGWRIAGTPTGFIPQQDQGYLIGVVQLPPGASLNRTDRAIRRGGDILRGVPGVKGVAGFAGLDGANFTANSAGGVFFIKLDDWRERDRSRAAVALAGEAMKRLSVVEEANFFILSPPPVDGLGTAGGFKMMIQDRSGAGYLALERAANAVTTAARGDARIAGAFAQFNTGSPRLVADVDREKALQLDVQPRDVYETLAAYLGSAYVNDFNFEGRTLRVTAQADAASRTDARDIESLVVRSQSGALVPLGSLVTLRRDTGPIRVVRYNLYPAAEVQGSAAPGVSSGQALRAMDDLASKALPSGFGYEWTELARQEREAGRAVALIFGLAVVLVFIVLAAYFEALTLSLAVVLIVPLCVLAAILGVNLRGQDNNILTQIGLIVLVALAAKNVILVVDFAKRAETGGLCRLEAAVSSAVTRLRPILMTSVAFVLGVVPLVYAVGPGAEMRRALGTAVFFGMIGVTAMGLLFTPAFYVLMRDVASFLHRLRLAVDGDATPGTTRPGLEASECDRPSSPD